MIRLLLLLLCPCLLALPSTAAEKPMNVVLIVADDLGWADLACYGSDLHETPNLDRLAAQSIRFTDAYAAAAICSPTRASLLTGKSPTRLGMTIWHEWAARGPDRRGDYVAAEAEPNLKRSEETLAEVLKPRGYATFHVGKWHVGDVRHYPETQGFDVNIGGTLWGAPPTFFWPYRGPFGPDLRYVPGLEGGQPGEYLTDRLTSEAMRLIEGSRARPFFLNLWYYSVHTPIEGKRKHVDYFTPRAEAAKQHTHPTYAAMVHSLDENVGRILAKLDELKMKSHTLVIFMSDNGGLVHKTPWGIATNNAPMRSGKGALYEGGIRIPFIVHWPGVTKPGVCSEPVISHDLFATILEILGVPQPPNPQERDGASLVSLLRNPQARLDRPYLCWHYPHFYPTTNPVSAIRSGNHKLLHFYQENRDELYDLSTDVSEKTNLAKSDPAKTAALRKTLDDWLHSMNARFPRRVTEKR